MTSRLLLTVEDTFEVRGRGLVLAPFLDESEARKDRFEVELRRPGGSTVRATAFAQIPFITPRPPTLRTHLAILSVSKVEVPIGTEVWTLGDENDVAI